MKQNSAIIIMAKVPRAGFSKTRLSGILNDEKCVELARCFLQDTTEKVCKIFENVVVAFTPDDGGTELKKLLFGNEILISQTGKNLGERMESAMVFAESKGFSPIIVIGTDSPTLPFEYLEDALRAFENPSVETVLGKANDGGYYLIGVRKFQEGIFEKVEWSSPQTFAQTAENARRINGSEPFEISAWYDVDTPEDFEILLKEFAENKSFKSVAPRTADWLEKFGKSF